MPSQVTYGQLRTVLSAVGFREVRKPDGVALKHAKSDTLFLFRPYRDSDPMQKAEIGHVRLDRNGTTLESRCSGWSIDVRIRSLKTEAPESILAGLIGENVGGEAKHLSAALEEGDFAAKKILHEIADDLAFGLSHVVHLFHPQIIILGGGLSGIGEPLRVAVHQALEGFIMDAFRPGPELALTELGEDAVPVGALELARRSSFGDTLPQELRRNWCGF